MTLRRSVIVFQGIARDEMFGLTSQVRRAAVVDFRPTWRKVMGEIAKARTQLFKDRSRFAERVGDSFDLAQR